MDLVSLLITWLITAVSLFAISYLPIGVEIDGFNKALLSAAVFGLLNAFVYPILKILALPLTFLTFGLFSIILNAIIFGLAAYLVTGFRLRYGFWSALLGAILLAFVRGLIYQFLKI
ncbi:MAG: phage holin family protein [Microcoleus vaginatus WJT46-NPBG5]|jgi:putative membrane protein|nr:phage holin family protein [Microcoleus vaginatus WJT46-NPBG5]